MLLVEAIPWETDPIEMKKQPFWRLMYFVIDKEYRGRGMGGRALEMAVKAVNDRYGVRPIALGCHKENKRAMAFYERHGSVKTNAMEGNDIYFLRFPMKEMDGAKK